MGTGDAPTSTGEASTADTSTADAGTTGSGDASTTGEPMASTGEPAASLAISDGPTYEFGDVPTGGQLSHVLTVTNTGDGEAQGLAGAVTGSFALSGGFPGTTGDCGEALAPGESCTVEVVFSPAELGRHAGTLTVSHDGGPEATRELAGGAIGQSDDLLSNGGGEEPGEPPPGWSAIEGQWIAGEVAGEVDPFVGDGYLYAVGGANNVDYSLRQEVDLGAWALTIDEAALRVSFSGRARGLAGAGGDEHRIRLHYFDASGGPVHVSSTNYQAATEWQEHTDSRVIPPGTRTVRVELNCRKNSGSICNAYFDALELRASYP